MCHQLAGVFQCERLDVDDPRGESRGLHGGLALLDILRARGDQQHIVCIRILLRGTKHFEVVAHLVHREWNVLVGLHLHLRLEITRAQRAWHLDHLGDGRIAADRHGRLAALGTGPLDRPADSLADGLRIHDRLLVDRVLWRRFGCIGLDPVLAPRHRQLDQLDGRSGDVQTEIQTIFALEQEHFLFPFQTVTPESARPG